MRLDAPAVSALAPAGTTAQRRLIVNADDFGRSASINAAITRAHEEGILTTASLMVNEAACQDAVDAAKHLPRLGVGLHLSLVCGRSALGARLPTGLVDQTGEFTRNAFAAGWRYFFRRELREPLRLEIRAQLERFQATGLRMDHLNGHLHLHLHPVIFSLLMEEGPAFGLKHVRLTHDLLRLNLRTASGRWMYRLSHWLIYRILSARARPVLRRAGIRHTSQVIGLLQDARVDETFICALLPELPAGDSELYSHPCLGEFRHEYEGLVSGRVKEIVQAESINLIRYQDL